MKQTNGRSFFVKVAPALPVLNRLLQNLDLDILTDACQIMLCLSAGSNEEIQVVVESGVVPPLVALLA